MTQIELRKRCFIIGQKLCIDWVGRYTRLRMETEGTLAGTDIGHPYSYLQLHTETWGVLNIPIDCITNITCLDQNNIINKVMEI